LCKHIKVDWFIYYNMPRLKTIKDEKDKIKVKKSPKNKNKNKKKANVTPLLETMENSCSVAYYLEEHNSLKGEKQDDKQDNKQEEILHEEGNITYFFNDDNTFSAEAGENDENLLELMKEFEEMEIKQAITETSVGNIEDDFLFAEIQNYTDNWTVKQLMQICDYYGLSKDIKTFKCKKPEIINFLLVFENDGSNFDLVMKRKQLWHCIEELKNDKYMKKFVLWD